MDDEKYVDPTLLKIVCGGILLWNYVIKPYTVVSTDDFCHRNEL